MNIGPKASIIYKDFKMVTPTVEMAVVLAETLRDTPLYNNGDLIGLGPWASELEPEKRYISSLQHQLINEKFFPSKDNWNLSFHVFKNNDFIGVQNLHGDTYRFNSGSWLLPKFRGKGYGSIIRSLVYETGFELGFKTATTRAYEANKPSWMITERLGAERVATTLREALFYNQDKKEMLPEVEYELKKENFVPLAKAGYKNLGEWEAWVRSWRV